MASTHNRKQSAVGYALIGGFVLLFIFLNWAGPGRILSLVSAVTVLVTLLSIRTRLLSPTDRAAPLGAFASGRSGRLCVLPRRSGIA